MISKALRCKNRPPVLSVPLLLSLGNRLSSNSSSDAHWLLVIIDIRRPSPPLGSRGGPPNAGFRTMWKISNRVEGTETLPPCGRAPPARVLSTCHELQDLLRELFGRATGTSGVRACGRSCVRAGKSGARTKPAGGACRSGRHEAARARSAPQPRGRRTNIDFCQRGRERAVLGPVPVIGNISFIRQPIRMTGSNTIKLCEEMWVASWWMQVFQYRCPWFMPGMRAFLRCPLRTYD